MLSRYRSVFAAIAGLTLASASPPAKSDWRDPAQASSDKIERALGDIASALKQANESSHHDKPCSDGYQDRSSDLCAQWKAADSAHSAANAAWWIGGFGLLVGALTLAAAAAAAKFAYDAARHTRDANELSKRALAQAETATKAEIQPYVFVDRIELVQSEAHPDMASITAVLKNYGATPALYIRPSIGWEVLDFPLVRKPTHGGMEPEIISEIAPQQELRVPYPVGESRIGASVLTGPNSGKALIAHVSLSYENRLDLKSASWSAFYVYDGPDKGFRRLVVFKDQRLGGMGDG